MRYSILLSGFLALGAQSGQEGYTIINPYDPTDTRIVTPLGQGDYIEINPFEPSETRIITPDYPTDRWGDE